VKPIFVGALLLSMVAGAEDAKFAKLKDSAEPVGGLGVFLDKFVGECNASDVGAADCKQAVREYRQKMRGKRLYMIVTEDNANMIQAGRTDFENGEFTAQLTPFFPSSGYALTHGAPSRTDANGNPVMPLMQIKGKIPADWNESRFNRLFAGREVRLHVVFTPQDVWSLPKRGGGKMSGVKARLEAVMITAGRTGEELAVWTPR